MKVAIILASFVAIASCKIVPEVAGVQKTITKQQKEVISEDIGLEGFPAPHGDPFHNKNAKKVVRQEEKFQQSFVDDLEFNGLPEPFHKGVGATKVVKKQISENISEFDDYDLPLGPGLPLGPVPDFALDKKIQQLQQQLQQLQFEKQLKQFQEYGNFPGVPEFPQFPKRGYPESLYSPYPQNFGRPQIPLR